MPQEHHVFSGLGWNTQKPPTCWPLHLQHTISPPSNAHCGRGDALYVTNHFISSWAHQKTTFSDLCASNWCHTSSSGQWYLGGYDVHHLLIWPLKCPMRIPYAVSPPLTIWWLVIEDFKVPVDCGAMRCKDLGSQNQPMEDHRPNTQL